VKELLAMLEGVEPAQAAYARRRMVPIVEVSGEELARCFPRSGRGFGETDSASRVFLNRSRADSDALEVATLAHELLHVQHGDRGEQASRHAHIWDAEEEECHHWGAAVAWKLGVRTPLILVELGFFGLPPAAQITWGVVFALVAVVGLVLF
jgi:hypothetical protein